LPAIAKTIKYYNDKVTAYQGMKSLDFFKVDECKRTKAMYSSRQVSKDVLEETCPIVNNILYST